ncbi:EF-hand domain-containing protein [Rhizobium binxianense]
MKTWMLCAALLVGLSPLSLAFGQETKATPLLERIDSNGDGSISKEEIVAARQRIFARLDRNGDGNVDQDEIESARDAIMDHADMMQAHLGTAWHRMDKDGSGGVSREEFQARTILFDLADRNGDGELSAAEIAVIRDLIGHHAG